MFERNPVVSRKHEEAEYSGDTKENPKKSPKSPDIDWKNCDCYRPPGRLLVSTQKKVRPAPATQSPAHAPIIVESVETSSHLAAHVNYARKTGLSHAGIYGGRSWECCGRQSRQSRECCGWKDGSLENSWIFLKNQAAFTLSMFS